MDPLITYCPRVQQAAIRPTRLMPLAAGEVLELPRTRHLTSLLFDLLVVFASMAAILGLMVTGWAVAS